MNKFKLALWKAYFDKGRSVTNYVFPLLILFGLYSWIQNIPLEATIILALDYLACCIFIGRLWYIKRMTEAEIEVQNHFNPFVIEMRNQYGK